MTLGPLDSLEELYNYLYTALQLEHATIPPYLTALYSIHPGTNSDAFHILRVVAVEEMLHATLVANIMNAVGMKPDLTQAGFIPEYPTYLPSGETDFEVSRERFCRESVETFLKIERPAPLPADRQMSFAPGDEPGGYVIPRKSRGKSLFAYSPAGGNVSFDISGDGDTGLHFYSIGEFYKALDKGLTDLEDKMKQEGKTLFIGDYQKQVKPEYYYSGGGEIIEVTDLASAQAAIRLISEQGEGEGGGIYDNEGELAHYYRFQQLQLGRYYQVGDSLGNPTGPDVNVDWDSVYNIKTDARLVDYPSDSAVYAAALNFNTYYNQFLGHITQAFNGQPQMLIEAVGDMFKIKEKAVQLMRNPIPGMPGVNASPTFEMPV